MSKPELAPVVQNTAPTVPDETGARAYAHNTKSTGSALYVNPYVFTTSSIFTNGPRTFVPSP